MTVNECLNLTESEIHLGECICTIGPRGGRKYSQEVWRINGQTKTWKREPGRFSIPIKHGLYHSSYLTQFNCDSFHSASDCKPREVKS